MNNEFYLHIHHLWQSKHAKICIPMPFALLVHSWSITDIHHDSSDNLSSLYRYSSKTNLQYSIAKNVGFWTVWLIMFWWRSLWTSASVWQSCNFPGWLTTKYQKPTRYSFEPYRSPSYIYTYTLGCIWWHSCINIEAKSVTKWFKCLFYVGLVTKEPDCVTVCVSSRLAMIATSFLPGSLSIFLQPWKTKFLYNCGKKVG